jgi:hypothetical protein
MSRVNLRKKAIVEVKKQYHRECEDARKKMKRRLELITSRMHAKTMEELLKCDG